MYMSFKTIGCRNPERSVPFLVLSSSFLSLSRTKMLAEEKGPEKFKVLIRYFVYQQLSPQL